MEQVFILLLLVMFAAIQGLAQWRRGIANSRHTNVPADWDTDGSPLDPFEAVEIQPPRIEPPKIAIPKAPRVVPQEHQSRGAQRTLPHASGSTGAPPAQRSAKEVGLHHTGLIPQTPAELRRAMALVAIFGPPRALDPPE